MTDRQKMILVGALVAAAAAIGGVLVAKFLMASADEDRPPIIVKGGSLIFESGVQKRPGKSWHQHQRPDGAMEFYQAPGRGKPISAFQLYFIGGTACSPSTVSEFTVYFDDDGEGPNLPKAYTVNIRELGGRSTATVFGPGVNVDSSNVNRLIVGGTGKEITSVTGANFNCSAPTEVWVESLR